MNDNCYWFNSGVHTTNWFSTCYTRLIGYTFSTFSFIFYTTFYITFIGYIIFYTIFIFYVIFIGYIIVYVYSTTESSLTDYSYIYDTFNELFAELFN